MRIGRYFKADSKSRFDEGIVSFIHLGEKIGDKYPISLVIKRNSIDFYYHSIIDPIEESYANNEDVRNTLNMRHINTSMIHLPLSGNSAFKDNLTSKLINYYKEKWKIYYLRDFILDFLFDLEHSKVFKNSPYFKEAELRLNENFLFNVIANKIRYYYNRRKLLLYCTMKKYKKLEYRDIYNEKRKRDNKRRNITSEEEILLRNLWESEKRWLENIFSKEYISLSQRCKGSWINKSTEKELKNIYDYKNKNDKYIKKLRSIFCD